MWFSIPIGKTTIFAITDPSYFFRGARAWSHIRLFTTAMENLHANPRYFRFTSHMPENNNGANEEQQSRIKPVSAIYRNMGGGEELDTRGKHAPIITTSASTIISGV